MGDSNEVREIPAEGTPVRVVGNCPALRNIRGKPGLFLGMKSPTSVIARVQVGGTVWHLEPEEWRVEG